MYLTCYGGKRVQLCSKRKHKPPNCLTKKPPSTPKANNTKQECKTPN